MRVLAARPPSEQPHLDTARDASSEHGDNRPAVLQEPYGSGGIVSHQYGSALSPVPEVPSRSTSVGDCTAGHRTPEAFSSNATVGGGSRGVSAGAGLAPSDFQSPADKKAGLLEEESSFTIRVLGPEPDLEPQEQTIRVVGPEAEGEPQEQTMHVEAPEADREPQDDSPGTRAEPPVAHTEPGCPEPCTPPVAHTEPQQSRALTPGEPLGTEDRLRATGGARTALRLVATAWVVLWLVAALAPLMAAAALQWRLHGQLPWIASETGDLLVQAMQLSATTATVCLGLLTWRWLRALHMRGPDVKWGYQEKAALPDVAPPRGASGSGPSRWIRQASGSTVSAWSDGRQVSKRSEQTCVELPSSTKERAESKDTSVSAQALVLELRLPSTCSDEQRKSHEGGTLRVPPAESPGGCGSENSMMSYRRPSWVSETCDLMVGTDTGQELVKAEVSDVVGEDKVRIEFKSKGIRTADARATKLIKEQQVLLQAMKSELEDARRALRARDDIREEQKELLRGFRKIVTKDVLDAKGGAQSHVTVFVVEEQRVLSEEMAALCSDLNYECQLFTNPADALESMREVLRRAAAQAPENDARGRWKSVARAVRPKNRFQDTVVAALKAAREARRFARVVFLGASLLDRLPPEWESEDLHVALISEPEEYEEVGRGLLASGETEVRDRLRKLGIHEYLLHPVSMEAFQGVIREGVRRHFADEYLLMKQLGRGAYGVVYQAKRLRDGEIFALKEINVRRLGSTDAGSVKAEAEMLQQLRWPTVLFLVDFWSNSDAQLYYLLMPLIEGGTLQDKLEEMSEKANVAGLERVREWYMQTMHGLSYLHWQGILHRDLKPGNLLLGLGGRALRIADFGSAERLPGSGPHPRRGASVKGQVTTPLYASPEVRVRETYYAASDCWAVGATFYQVATVVPGEALPDGLGTLTQGVGVTDRTSYFSNGPKATTANTEGGSGTQKAAVPYASSSYASTTRSIGRASTGASGTLGMSMTGMSSDGATRGSSLGQQYGSNAFTSNSRKTYNCGQIAYPLEREVARANVTPQEAAKSIAKGVAARALRKSIANREATLPENLDNALEQDPEPVNQVEALAEDLSRLLKKDPMKRACAAELAGRDSNVQYLQVVLADVGAFPEAVLSGAHFKEFDRIISDSAAAAAAAPPQAKKKAKAAAKKKPRPSPGGEAPGAAGVQEEAPAEGTSASAAGASGGGGGSPGGEAPGAAGAQEEDEAPAEGTSASAAGAGAGGSPREGGASGADAGHSLGLAEQVARRAGSASCVVAL